MKNPDQLNDQWAIGEAVRFESGPGGLPVAILNSDLSSATLSLYGAHLLSFIPAGNTDLLWVSSHSPFEEGKAIRGGIPVCFPWFGPHPDGAPMPQHGFGRLMYWNPCATGKTETGVTFIELELLSNEETFRYFPGHFRATLRVELNQHCRVSLTVTNTGKESFELSGALHSYFRVSDIRNITVEGLQNLVYLEAGSDEKHIQTDATLAFTGETNRRYLGITHECLLNDPGLNRSIRISKEGSRVNVVWNPWEAVCRTMKDMAPDDYLRFLCIEPANAVKGEDIILLKAGATHTLATTLQMAD